MPKSTIIAIKAVSIPPLEKVTNPLNSIKPSKTISTKEVSPLNLLNNNLENRIKIPTPKIAS